MQMSAEEGVSRRGVLATGSGVAALLASPFAASAAKYGPIGYAPAEVLDPASGTIDKSILETPKVQAALKNVYGYLAAVKEIESRMNSDEQTDVKRLVSIFEFSALRSNLNTVNSALDEDTQRGTDRLIRATIQDITEIDEAGKLKPGVPRSARKIAIIKGKLAKLDGAFTDFLKFFPKPSPKKAAPPPPPPPPPAPEPEAPAPAAAPAAAE